MKISVTYEDSDVAKALSKIIKDPNADQFIKLFTPMICTSQQATEYFFKLMLGNKLPEVIPNDTLCYMPISQMGYSANKDIIENSDLCINGSIVVVVKDFRGYHEYSAYTVEYTNILPDGSRKKDITYTSTQYLTTIEDL